MIDTVRAHMSDLVELLDKLDITVTSVTVETEDGVFIMVREATDDGKGE